MKKFRVFCTDPDATDSSSSDEDNAGPKPAKRKRFIREVNVGGDPPEKPRGPPSPAEVPVKKKFPGVRMRKWGKFAAEIRHPVARQRIWLGTFDTAEEAYKVWLGKRLEFDAYRTLHDLGKPNKKDSPVDVNNDSILSKSNSNSACVVADETSCFGTVNVDKLGEFGNKNVCNEGSLGGVMDVEKLVGEGEGSGGSVEVPAGVERVKSGKWVARINYPDSSGRIWMGMFSTMEEAAFAYDKKKVELEERYKGKESVDGGICAGGELGVGVRKTREGKRVARVRHPNHKSLVSLGFYRSCEKTPMAANKEAEVDEMFEGKENVDDDFVGRKLPRGVRDNGYGRWEARIWHPKQKDRVSLGAYSSPEEAGLAVGRKRDQFEKLYGYKSRVQSEFGAVSMGECFKDGSNAIELPRGVKKTESGKWAARIRHPKKKSTIWLGTYNTPEAAARAFNKKKAEFEERFKVKERVNGAGFVIRETVLGLACPSLSGEKQALNEKVANLDSNGVTNSEMPIDGVLPDGITMTKSGRWGVRVTNSSNGTKHWIGSYPTVEEAVRVFNRKMADLDKKFNSNKRARLHSEPIVSQKKPDSTACYYSPTSVLDTENSNRSTVSDDQNSVLVDAPINVHYDLGYLSPDAIKSKYEVPDVSNFDEAVGLGIINEYGELLGEFSKLDEPMWFDPDENAIVAGY